MKLSDFIFWWVVVSIILGSCLIGGVVIHFIVEGISLLLEYLK